MKTVCIIGNYSGRNAGDAAMLEGMMADLTDRYGKLKFVVPTLSPSFVRRSYARFNPTPVDVSPRNFAVKMAGYPAWRAMRDADLVLITDAILFDRHLFNPVHNYLFPLSLMLPSIAAAGVPVALYNVSIGPISTPTGRWCLRRVLRAASITILRDDDSLRTIAPVGVKGLRIEHGADSALLAQPSPPGRVRAVLDDLGIRDGESFVGMNLNRYGTAFLRRAHHRVSHDEIVDLLAGTIRDIRAKLGARVCLFSTQHMDESLVKRLQARAGGPSEVPLASNRALSYNDLIGVMGRMRLMVGMRTHSVILATSAGRPVVGVITYPKTLGYLKRIGFAEHSIGLDDVSPSALWALIERAWGDIPALESQIRVAVERERAASRAASLMLSPWLGRPVAHDREDSLLAV